MNRFVVLFHEHPGGNHWDLMLETGAALTTWALPPQSLPLEPFECRAKILPDHRLRYLDYEGQISDNRGCVRRIDAGTYETEEPNRFRLHGKIFNGVLAIGEGSETDSEVLLQFRSEDSP